MLDAGRAVETDAVTRRGRSSGRWCHDPAMAVGALPLRTRLALRVSRLASGLSAALGRGRGTVIGGAVATVVDPRTLQRLAAGRTTAFVTATNGKSTTTTMLAAAARTLGPVAHNDGGSNMESGLIVALDGARSAPFAILE